MKKRTNRRVFFLIFLIISSFLIIFSFNVTVVKALTPAFVNAYLVTGSGGSVSLTLNFTPTSGNMLVLLLSVDSNDATAHNLTSITQANVNWQSSAGATIWLAANRGGCQIWAGNITNSPSTNIISSFNGGGTITWRICVMEFSNAIAVYDKNVTASASSGTAIFSGNTSAVSTYPEVAVSVANAAHFSGVPLQGYTSLSNGDRQIELYKILSTQTTTGTGGTGYTSSWWTIAVLTLKPYQSGITCTNFSNSSNENGVNTVINFTSTPSNPIYPQSGYVFSWDISGSYVNDTWVQFTDGTYQNISLTKLIFTTLGNTIHFKIYGNDSLNNWSVSDIQTISTIQATITFYFNTGGGLWRNNAAISNGTVTTYSSPATLSLTAICNSTYAFESFNYTNTVGASTTNPFSLTVTNQSTVTLYFAQDYNVGYGAGYSSGWNAGNNTGWIAGNASGYASGYSAGYSAGYTVGYIDGQNAFVFIGTATPDRVLDGYTFYGNSQTLLTGTYTTPTPSPTPTLTPTPTATPTPTPGVSGTPNPSDYIPVADAQNQTITYALVVGLIAAVLVFCLFVMAASRSSRRK
jgi:hypothetical protein